MLKHFEKQILFDEALAAVRGQGDLCFLSDCVSLTLLPKRIPAWKDGDLRCNAGWLMTEDEINDTNQFSFVTDWNKTPVRLKGDREFFNDLIQAHDCAVHIGCSFSVDDRMWNYEYLMQMMALSHCLTYRSPDELKLSPAPEPVQVPPVKAPPPMLPQDIENEDGDEPAPKPTPVPILNRAHKMVKRMKELLFS